MDINQKVCNGSAVTGLLRAERATEATMDCVIKKCPRGTSNERDQATSKDFWGQEEEQGRDNVEDGKEVASNYEDVEERKDTGTPQQGSSGDPNKKREVKESNDKEEQNGETRGEDTTPGAETDREPDREECTMRRPRHIPGGM
ncbi:hypothetical protein NDU88_005274 [Pleurodeles waltl]|uniref:Uncharacterized protein n=1 Tax=Pleurodeles waltl TaxID=8319 RepID=A0AAV7QGR7_PLEWA|nr:hypothetical protein NDU88_005250 [Pleurodeles waltl]KAJ1138894.1 hypothetical protein NDU88_005274 [Pleurodeles waltl]